MEHQLEANFSTLIMSLASSAAVSLGLSPNPQTNKTDKNMETAQFNIDLIEVLKNKTTNNLTEDESKLVEHILSDLKLHFVEAQKH